jgi:hypothetical protein
MLQDRQLRSPLSFDHAKGFPRKFNRDFESECLRTTAEPGRGPESRFLPGRYNRTLGSEDRPEILKKPGSISRREPKSPIEMCRHDGKEAKRMGRKATGQRQGELSEQDGASPASPSTVKVTLHLSVETAQRLGIESAMRRISQSAIAEEVLAAYLSRWNLPTVSDAHPDVAGRDVA